MEVAIACDIQLEQCTYSAGKASVDNCTHTCCCVDYKDLTNEQASLTVTHANLKDMQECDHVQSTPTWMSFTSVNAMFAANCIATSASTASHELHKS